MTALNRKRNKKVSESHTTTTTTNQKGIDVGAMGGGNADTLLWQFVSSHTTNRNGRSSTTIIKWIVVISAVALFILRLLFINNESIFNKIDDNGNYDYDYYYKSLISIPAAIRTNNKIADVNVNDDADADADFSVNFNINFNNPQIVMLAGPHKTASTTIQTFMVQLAGQTVSLEGWSKPLRFIHINTTNNLRPSPTHFKQYHVPHPSNQDWVWPLNSKNRTRNEGVEIAGIKIGRPSKFYAPLLAWITGRRNNKFLDKSKRKRGYNTNTRAKQKQVLNYYRDLFQNVWNTHTENDNIYKYDNNNNKKNNNNNNIDDGTTPPPTIWKKIVFGAEAFDTFVHDLPVDDNGNGNGGNSNNKTNTLLTGEDLHISPSANKRINLLLDIMPWHDDKKNKDTITNDSSNSNSNNNPRRRPELKLEDIEVVVNYRTPRISHMVSIWHQLGHEKTLQDFLITPPNGRSTGRGHYQLNSLGLALQFVRRGIKTTILDMKGVQEKEEAEEEQQQQQQHDGDQDKHNNNESTDNILEIGGLQGVIACDVLKVSNMCNDRGKLMMSIDTTNGSTNNETDNVAIQDKNKKSDKLERNLTEQQLNDIDIIIKDYDCYVWKHLQKYNKMGTLRILYPSKSNTANLYNKTGPCRNSGGTAAVDDDDDNYGKELTFQSMLTKIGNIARVPYVDDSPPPAAVIAEDPTETEKN